MPSLAQPESPPRGLPRGQAFASVRSASVSYGRLGTVRERGERGGYLAVTVWSSRYPDGRATWRHRDSLTHLLSPAQLEHARLLDWPADPATFAAEVLAWQG